MANDLTINFNQFFAMKILMKFSFGQQTFFSNFFFSELVTGFYFGIRYEKVMFYELRRHYYPPARPSGLSRYRKLLWSLSGGWTFLSKSKFDSTVSINGWDLRSEICFCPETSHPLSKIKINVVWTSWLVSTQLRMKNDKRKRQLMDS